MLMIDELSDFGMIEVDNSNIEQLLLAGLNMNAIFFRYFDSDPGTVSWVGSLLCGVYLMSGPVVGGLVNKYGCRPVCIAGHESQ